MSRVPWQLRDETFIVLSERGKSPVQRWSQKEYQFDAEHIQKWIDDGWNYGVIYHTDLCVFDADNADGLMQMGVIQALPKTFTVMSGREGLGLHLYFRMPRPPEGTKIYLYSESGDELGDIRLPHSRFYNVGPGSVHPSGNPYKVICDVDIAVLEWDTLEKVLHGIKTKVAGLKHELEIDTSAKKSTSSSDEYGFTVLDFLMPEKPQTRDGEIEGAHPIHGSSTGNNLTVKADGSVWWCRRCGSGGNWIDALAVSEGIIDCSQAHPGRSYSKEEWKKINQVLRKLNPAVYNQQMKKWIDERHAATIGRLQDGLSAAYSQVKT